MPYQTEARSTSSYANVWNGWKSDTGLLGVLVGACDKGVLGGDNLPFCAAFLTTCLRRAPNFAAGLADAPGGENPQTATSKSTTMTVGSRRARAERAHRRARKWPVRSTDQRAFVPLPPGRPKPFPWDRRVRHPSSRLRRRRDHPVGSTCLRRSEPERQLR